LETEHVSTRTACFFTWFKALPMFKNYFKVARRNLWKHKLFTSVNVLGLSVGLICVILLLLAVQQMVSRDDLQQKADRVYLMETGNEKEGNGDRNVFPLLDLLLQQYPEVENGTRINTWDSRWLIHKDKEVNQEITYVDPGFLEVFTFPIKYGTPVNALANKQSIVLSEEVAASLFGPVDPTGKTISFDDDRQYTVTAVMKSIPSNSSLRPTVLLSNQYLKDDVNFKNIANWYNSFTKVYVLLKPGASAAGLVRKMPQLVTQHFSKEAQDRYLYLLPFKEDAQKYGGFNFELYTYILSCIALFILLLVMINLINLNMANAFTRTREVGVRKILGSGKGQLLLQFIIETGLVVLIAVILGILGAWYLMPVFNQLFTGLTLTGAMLFNPYILTILFSVGAVLTFIAGGYPAIYLSSIQLANSIKGKLKAAPQKIHARQSLIIIQFIITVIFIAGSLIIKEQVHFMKDADVHFNKDNVLIANLSLDYKDAASAKGHIDYMLSQLSSNEKIKAVSITNNVPGGYDENYNAFLPAEQVGDANPVGIRQVSIDDGYANVFQLKLLEGRVFLASMKTDEDAVIINHAAMKALGWSSIEGKSLRGKGSDAKPMPVIGMVADYHYQSLAGKVEPLVHFYTGKTRMRNDFGFLSINIKPKDAAPVIAMLEKEFKNIPSRKALTYTFADELFNQQYKQLEGILSLINWFTIISVGIACAGIFALISVVARQRTKEIGIRKVLGASVGGIVWLLSLDFVKLVIVAVFIGSPIAWWAMHKWLQGFAYQVNLSIWIFILTGSAAVLIALLTVSIQSIKAALTNPVKSLRAE
jgi:putative ABC transport system permease protein